MVNNKVFLFVSLFALVLGQTPADRQKYLEEEKKALIKCQKEGGFPESIIDDVFVRRVAPPDSKCFTKCVYGDLGWLNGDGFPDLPSMVAGMKRQFVESTSAVQTITTCHGAVPAGANDCDSAFSVLDCFYKAMA